MSEEDMQKDMVFQTCVTFEAEIESEIDKFMVMSETERAEHLKKPGWSLVEFIFPTCDNVAMGNADDGRDLVVIGPRVSNYLWNPNPNPLNPPGTGCDESFESDNDGLCVRSTDSIENLLPSLNSFRMTAAKYHNIGNMLQLSWSKELEEIARHQNTTELESNPDSNVKWRYAKTSTMKFNIFESLFDGHLRCGRFERLDKQPEAIAGSTCPNDFHVKDGLCIQLGDSNEFLDHLNDFRQNHSHMYNIPNMIRIVWDEELVKLAEKLDWSESKDPVVKDYRYVLLNDYRDIQKRLDKEVSKLNNFTASAREEAFRIMSKTSLGLSELLDPQRNVIGCAYKDQPIAPGLLCILGPIQKDVKSPPKKKPTLTEQPEKTLTEKPESPAPEADESKTTRQPMSNFWSILFLLLASRLF